MNCTSLTQIYIPGNVKTIGDYAFEFCSNLETVVISDGVESIGSFILSNCESITDVTLPYAGQNLTEVESGDGSSLGWLFCQGVPERGYYMVYYYLADRGIPNSLKSITITGGTKLPTNAFCGFKSLESVELPSTLLSISYNAFEDCTGLKNIDFIPNNVKSIEDRAFKGCSNVVDTTIPEGIVTIGEEAFFECSSLENISLPSTLKTIGREAFGRCSSLPEIIIPQNVSAIHDYAFYECSSLEEMVIPGSVKSVGRYLFDSCISLKEVKIENGVAQIGEYVFNGCTSLEKVYLPFAGQKEGDVAANSEYPIAKTLFCNIWSDDAYSVDGYGVPYTLKSIIITGGSCIPSYAFYGLKSVSNITIYGEQTTIYENAFDGCTALTSIAIPKNIEFIERDAFVNCTSLSEAKIYNPNVTIYSESTTFPKITTIYGWDNSTTQKYASDTNHKFISLGKYNSNAIIIGDCNDDGIVNEFDLIILQKWILAVPDIEIVNWKAADLCEDNRLDTFDLCLMRRKLIDG